MRFDDWRRALIDGDAAKAEAALAAAQKTCGCVSDTDNCLIFPGYSQLTAPSLWRETARRLLEWRAETFAKCAPMLETSPAEINAKRQCFAGRSRGFADGLAGESFGRVLAAIPLAMVETSLKKLGEAPAPSGPDKKTVKVYTEDVKTIGKQICDLSRELEEATDKLDHVKRRGHDAGGAKQKRIEELENEIRDLTDTIVGLKRRFQGMTGGSWNPYDFCGPAADKEKK